MMTSIGFLVSYLLHVLDYMMAHGSGKRRKVCVDTASMFARLSELCVSPFSSSDSRGTSASTSSSKTINSTHGKPLCDVVYEFHKPEKQMHVEIVFIHGLEFDGSKEAYWKTWMVRDGTQDNCWPETWLVEEFPHARILSLSYDAHVMQTPTSGRMDPYILGESLYQQMILVGIGQHECPVVFVCHSFGGLVAKQIVVRAFENLSQEEAVQNFLCNIRGFYFYATPHAGVEVDISPSGPFFTKGSVMKYMEVFCVEVGRLNSKFEQIHGIYEWFYYSVGEMHRASNGRLVVPESSARQIGGGFSALGAGHFDICKPKTKENSGYLFLLKFISKVIDHNKDKRHCLLNLPNGLVGVDDMCKSICGKLDTVSIIGLVGMGGIGKTTISECVYKSQTKFYDRACFLRGVRSKDVTSLQKHLLLELCGKKLGNEDDVSEDHLWSIQQCIKQKKVLIVIDDVGDSKTLGHLQVRAFEGSGSRVIVTCRNRQVFDAPIGMEGLKGVEIMDVDGLSHAQALQLFQYHAFGGVGDEGDEMKYFQGLAMDIAKACCGLPLSLEVIGKHLCKYHMQSLGLRKEIWKEALRKLREAMPLDGGDENEVLWERLRISYNDLSNDTKSMFLDFACFFCEKEREYLNEQSIGWIWNSPIGLQNLLARSLIKVCPLGEGSPSFTMHDQLRDMGRRIVKDLSLNGLPENMSRLWEVDEITSFLKANQSSSMIEGISIQGYVQFDPQRDPRPLRKLRLLDLAGCNIEIVNFFLRRCCEKLSWLCLDSMNGMGKPCDIEGIKLCTGLRVLQMTYTLIKELPVAIGTLGQLLELDLTGCRELQSLPFEIGHLKRLKRLQLCGCWGLTKLPQGVSQLIDLEYLGLGDCISLRSMVEFETPMEHHYELERLEIPFKSLGKLHQLQTLDMRDCCSLVIANPWESFQQLSRLEKLDLTNCMDMIPGISLDISHYDTLKEVESLWDQMIGNFSSCLKELHLPAFSHASFPTWPMLRVLEVGNWFRLEELPTSFGELTQLKKLKVYDSTSTLKKLLNSLFKLVKLEVLIFDNVEKLEKLPEQLGHLSSLKILKIRGMEKMEELPSSLGELFQLEQLSLKGCVNLKWLPESFRSLTRLSRLNLWECHVLQVMDEDQEIVFEELEERGCRIFNPPHIEWDFHLQEFYSMPFDSD